MNTIWLPVPCLVLGYNRIKSLQELVQNLIMQKTPRIYVSLDGPRNSAELELQLQLISMLEEIRKRSDSEIIIRVNHVNLGLRLAVIEGISWFFDHEEFGVILEDDLVLHAQFQEYFSISLNNSQVRKVCKSVSGNQFLELQEFGVIHFPLIWGWGTWKHAWAEILSEITGPSNFTLPWLRHPFLSGFVRAGLIRINSKSLNSWAFSFLAASISNNWLHLAPPFPIVSNSGDDSSATHTTSIPSYAKPISSNSYREFVLPNELQLNSSLERFVVKKHYGVHFRHVLSPMKAKFEICRTDKGKLLR